MQKGDDLVALVAFAAASAVLSWTVSRLNEARRTAEQRERETQIRLDLTMRLMAGEDPDTVVARAADALVALFALVRCTLRAPGTTTTASGPGTPGRTTAVTIAPLDVEITASREHPLGQADRALLEALVAGLAAAIDRLRLEVEAREARIDAQVGRTRSGFLSAVTHNLRTPLASIKAASSTLRAPGLALDPSDRTELLDTIYDETERLERLVTNLLELSRIRAGALDVCRQPVDLRDLAQAAIRRLRPLARAHRIRLDVPSDLGDVEVDIEMMEQVFGNLLENALRFAPPGSEILVSAPASRIPPASRYASQTTGPACPTPTRPRSSRNSPRRRSSRRNRDGPRLGDRAGTRDRARRQRMVRGDARGRRDLRVPHPDRRVHRERESMTTVLVVEDDASLRRALRMSLARGRSRSSNRDRP